MSFASWRRVEWHVNWRTSPAALAQVEYGPNDTLGITYRFGRCGVGVLVILLEEGSHNNRWCVNIVAIATTSSTCCSCCRRETKKKDRWKVYIGRFTALGSSILILLVVVVHPPSTDDEGRRPASFSSISYDKKNPGIQAFVVPY
jgi:hypothetical protein